MSATSREPRSGCAINAAVEVIGDRWSLVVLRDIMFGDRRHFRDLQRNNEEGIASNILASRLRDLVANGLLSRDHPGPGRPVTYRLTEAAIELVPVLAELGWWGLKHRPTTEALRVRAELLYEGGRPLWDEFMAELRSRHLGEPGAGTGRPTVLERLSEAVDDVSIPAPTDAVRSTGDRAASPVSRPEDAVDRGATAAPRGPAAR